MNRETQNQGGGAPADLDIDSAIKAERSVGAGLQESTRAYDAHVGRLTDLYKQKASLLTREEKPESIRNFRHDQGDVDPATGKPFTEEQRQSRAELDELRGDLVNQYGQDALSQLGETLIGEGAPFKTPEVLDAFVARAGLDLDGQREMLLGLAEINKMSAPDVEIPVEKTIESVGQSLRSMWRDQFDAHIETARKVAVEIFGSIERWDDYATAKGWANNPAAQTRAVTLLLRLGRLSGKK